jgi:hypothetical protein
MERKGEAEWEMYECRCLRMQDAMEFPIVIVAWMTRALLSRYRGSSFFVRWVPVLGGKKGQHH